MSRFPEKHKSTLLPTADEYIKRLPVRHRSGVNGLGWRPAAPDARDYLYAAPVQWYGDGAPGAIDFRSDLSAVGFQGETCACTAFAVAAAIEFDRKKQQLPVFAPSPLFIYYNTRVIEHDIESDNGAANISTIKAVQTLGAPPEINWPFDPANLAVKPSDQAYQSAKSDLVSKYMAVSKTVQQLQGCLAAGFPFVFGLTIYDSFYDNVDESGVVPMPAGTEGQRGGHTMLAVGYKDADRQFIVRNSWGASWGDNGYCYLTYEYMIGPHTGEFYTVRSVSGG